MNEYEMALDLARRVHGLAGATQTFLFGSRARGDHRPDSDVDVAIILDSAPADEALEAVRSEARHLQRERLPEASGIDVFCLTLEGFCKGLGLRNNMANTIAREGKAVMAGEEYRFDYREEEIDWQDVEDRMRDAVGAATDLNLLEESGYVERMTDKTVGRMGQTALENAYKALLGANGSEYPASGRDGHNLGMLVNQIREDLRWPENEAVPGEQHRYLTVFGGAAVYAHEHPPLDKERIAQDVPEDVRTIQRMVDEIMNP